MSALYQQSSTPTSDATIVVEAGSTSSGRDSIWHQLICGPFMVIFGDLLRLLKKASLGCRYAPMPSRDILEEDCAPQARLKMAEELSSYLCWLRGIIAYLSIILYLLSFLPSSVILRFGIFFVSQLSCLLISKAYDVFLQLEGLYDSTFHHLNVISSPLLPFMLIEVIFWNIQTPMIIAPFMPNCVLFIDYMLFLRLYAVMVYYRYLSCGCQVVPRFMFSLQERQRRPTTAFFLRSVLYHQWRWVLPAAVLLWWMTVSLLLHKAAYPSLSISQSGWLGFQSITTVYYHDTLPTASLTKAVMSLAWVGNVALWGYIGAVTLLRHSPSQCLVQSYGVVQELSQYRLLSVTLRHRAARVLQAAWRRYRTRRRWLSTMAAEGVQIPRHGMPIPLRQPKYFLCCALAGWKLYYSLLFLRRTRSALRGATRRINESLAIGYDTGSELIEAMHRVHQALDINGSSSEVKAAFQIVANSLSVPLKLDGAASKESQLLSRVTKLESQCAELAELATRVMSGVQKKEEETR